MAPSGYIQSRQLAATSSTKYFTTLVDNRPYLPNLTIDPSDESSLQTAAVAVLLLNAARDTNDVVNSSGGATYHPVDIDISKWQTTIEEEEAKCLTCTRVTGGITNALFRISGLQSLFSSDAIRPIVSSIQSCTTNNKSPATSSASLYPFDSILLRIFGAEGMINRDIETSTYAALCRADIAHEYLGRFANGRMEGWLEGYLPLTCNDLGCPLTSLEIAKSMARLHCLFVVPEGELRDHYHGKNGSEDEINVGLWDQLKSWMGQAKSYTEFKTIHDTERVKKLELNKIEAEVHRFIESYTNQDSSSDNDNTIVFCHNDMLAANIMRHPETNKIQLIDFEYGGTNYKAFDIANHFNEHAGGTTAEEGATPDYNKFPTRERQRMFCVEYVKMAKKLDRQKSGLVEANNAEEKDADDVVDREAMELLDQVKEFVLINHLYWGLWAVNQAAEEGCEEFDYITYATNRFNQFYKQKAEWESK